MKFLANEPMMQFLMHPFHRNDLTGSTIAFMEFYSGASALTPAELAYSQTTAVNLTTGFLNCQAMSNYLRTTRTMLSHGIGTGQGFSPPPKSHYGTPDSKAILFSQRDAILNIVASGTAALAMVLLYDSSYATQSRCAFICSVGGIGSGAEIEMEDTAFAVGKRIKLNDFIIKISGLYGE